MNFRLYPMVLLLAGVFALPVSAKLSPQKIFLIPFYPSFAPNTVFLTHDSAFFHKAETLKDFIANAVSQFLF
jgi:hypothetical protein